MRVLLPCSFFMVQYSFKCERNVFHLNGKKKPVDVYMENISNVNALALNHLSTSEIYNSEMVRWSGANYAAVYLLMLL